MAIKSVAILGATGMLGSMLLDLFSRDKELNITATLRDKKVLKDLKRRYPKVEFRVLDVGEDDFKKIAKAVDGSRWIVNAIGITKPYIKEDAGYEINRAIFVNSRFPHLLVRAAKELRSQILQIATDCVFSGKKGNYLESDVHDALDVYGKTKSLGEVFDENIYHLRSSIIGPEPKAHVFLLDWLLSQPKDGQVNGFINHNWNGITTLHFAKICRGIIENKLALPHLQHIVPGNKVSKAKMLKVIKKEFKRADIKVNDQKAPYSVDRTLTTLNKKLNRTLWKKAGYQKPPTIEKMIKELAEYQFVV